jgi:hypothetical protein
MHGWQERVQLRSTMVYGPGQGGPRSDAHVFCKSPGQGITHMVNGPGQGSPRSSTHVSGKSPGQGITYHNYYIPFHTAVTPRVLLVVCCVQHGYPSV